MGKRKDEDACINGENSKEDDRKRQLLELELKALEKKYGYEITTVDKIQACTIDTISTGCLGLDLALGNGGMGVGRIYEIYGPEMSGKSTLADNVIIQAQRLGHNCLYVDAEASMDKTLLEKYGVDGTKLHYICLSSGEENLDAALSLIKTGIFKVVVIDSVAALVPKTETEGNLADTQQPGRQAAMMSRFLRLLTPVASETGTIVIFINQLRMKIGQMGNPETTTGGEALKYYATGRIDVRGGQSKKSLLVDDKNGGEVIGHKTEFYVKKNKLAPPHRKAEVKLIYGCGYDHHWEVLGLAADIGIVEKTGNWYKYNDKNIGNGELNTLAFLKDAENTEVFKEICGKVMANTGLKEIYESHGQQGPMHP